METKGSLNQYKTENKVQKQNIERLKRTPIDIFQLTQGDNNVFQSKCFRLLPPIEKTVSQRNISKPRIKQLGKSLDIENRRIFAKSICDGSEISTKFTTDSSNLTEHLHNEFHHRRLGQKNFQTKRNPWSLSNKVKKIDEYEDLCDSQTCTSLPQDHSEIFKEEYLKNYFVCDGYTDTEAGGCGPHYCTEAESECSNDEDNVSNLEDRSSDLVGIVDGNKTIDDSCHSSFSDDIHNEDKQHKTQKYNPNTDDTLQEGDFIENNVYDADGSGIISVQTNKTKGILDSQNQFICERNFQKRSKRNIMSSASASLQSGNFMNRKNSFQENINSRSTLSESALGMPVINIDGPHQGNIPRKKNHALKHNRPQLKVVWNQPVHVNPDITNPAIPNFSVGRQEISEHRLSTSNQLNEAMEQMRKLQRRASYREERASFSKRLGSEILPSSRMNLSYRQPRENLALSRCRCAHVDSNINICCDVNKY